MTMTMLGSHDVIVAANNPHSFHRDRQHHSDIHQQMMNCIIRNSDYTSDGDATSLDKSSSNNNPVDSVSKLNPNTGRTSRRKQLAPRSRLVRQCDLCDFSSSVISEFRTHMKLEHQEEQIFFCDICRYYSTSTIDFNRHLSSHQDSSKINHRSPSPTPMKVNHSPVLQISSNMESEGENDDRFENQLNNHDDLKEQNSDDEQNPFGSLNKKSNLSVTSSHSHRTEQPVSIVPDRKRPYNVSVDPARYRRVPDPDDANSVKFACSLCGNLYKWRKSLNKHWKEKHNDEEPPPLDAPVTIRPSKTSQLKTSNPIQTNMLPIPSKPTQSEHPAFSMNNYAWLKLATSMSINSSIDQSPLDLRIKSTGDRDNNNNTNNHTYHDDDGRDSSDDASSSSPQNSYSQKNFICSICDQRFVSVETINEHFVSNHLDELENEIAGKSPPRNTNVAQQNEEWNLSDPVNPLKCIQCDFVGRWPTELQKHAASHSTSRPFKCLVCSLTYKWRWDLAKHWDRAHASNSKGINLINPYKKRDRDQARTLLDLPTGSSIKAQNNADRQSISSSISNDKLTKNLSDDEQSQNLAISDSEDEQMDRKKQKNNNTNQISFPSTSLNVPPSLSAAMYLPSPFFPHHPMFSSFLNSQLLHYSSRLPHLPVNPNLELIKQAAAAAASIQRSASPNSSRSSASSSPRPLSPPQNQQRMNSASTSLSGNHQFQQQRKFQKEDRNFQCRWCDYRGRWRSELIQHMRCHHARDKPYHCSVCPYASSWKWDVQKHVKKQHANDAAKIIELPDKYLFQTNLKGKSDGTYDHSLNTMPLTEEDYRVFGADVQEKLNSMKYTRDRTLSCQQCPFGATSMTELRRHLIVHSSESPYHCFNCNYKSKWKCDVKKHMKVCNHHGPVLVGRKAMAKVMESLGLIIEKSKTNKSNEQKSVDDEIEPDDVDDVCDEEDNDEIVVDENQHEIRNDKQKATNRTQNTNLRCRQCDYEADDLSDLLLHRKSHATIRGRADFDKKYHSDIENYDNNQSEQIFDYEIEWLENNPLIKQFATVHQKTRLIIYQCSKCHFKTNNNHQNFLEHVDQQHPNLLDDQM